VKKLLKAARDVDPGLLLPLEWLAAKVTAGQTVSDAPLLILLATPRSGSTFCYQLMCHSFEVDYFSNLFYMGYRYPFLAKKIERRIGKEYISNFRSDYGFVAGLNGVAEANDIWASWFDQHLSERQPTPSASTIARATSFFDFNFSRSKRPFVTGWIGHILYAEQMAKLFPQAIFVNLTRNTQDVALSLLRARRSQNGDIEQWFSTRPVECATARNLSGYQQVALQTVSLQKRASKFVAAHTSRVFDIDYNKMCENPEAVMSELHQFCNAKGIGLTVRNITNLPGSDSSAPLVDDDYNLVKEALEDVS